MLLNFFSILLSLIFFTLGTIHFNWFLGGKWGFKNTIPTNKNGDLVLKPKPFDSLIVGLILIVFACFYLLQINIIKYKLPDWTKYLFWMIPTFFLLRSIGEFKYIGFFKKIKSTNFAKWDDKLFSPLCLFVSFLAFLIAFYN